MKRSWLPLLIAFVVLVAVGGIVSKIFFQHQRQFLKIEIPVSYLETTDSSRFSLQPILIHRSLMDDSMLVFFPKNESKSNVFLYDQINYNRQLFGDHHGVPVFFPYADGLTAIFGRPVLNLSGFPSGKYYAHVTGCDFGGFLQLNISDSAR